MTDILISGGKSDMNDILISGGKSDMNDKKIVVLFPCGNYSTDSPLLYYAGFKLQV
ncbi:hypothetical protein HMPREF1982_02358 [Clostridiales bacterium oral taxon 876 str. F0540]|nr:hypothetical protein HMPREF1982_02358 [Clostridiales bacterium oral taxon 876 str. F0540]